MDVRVALLLVATVPFAPVAGVASGSTVDDFEKAAAVSEQFLDLGCVVYDRLDRTRDCANQAGAGLARGDYPIADLEALTRHRDPFVRALALVCLFQKGDPKLLPVIFRLVDDPGRAFPAHTPYAFISPLPTAFSQIPQTRQTVGVIAEGMLAFFLTRAGYSYGSRGVAECRGFADYWVQRKDRDRLASWYTVQLDRATQGTSPIPDGRDPMFAALRSRVNALAGEDRLWYTLFVGASEGGDRVFSEAELLTVSKALGPDRLMLMLANRAPASDPDLAPVSWPPGCGRAEIGEEMRYFVLDHAPALLRPDDARALLESPKAQYSQWAIAAAALRPDLGERILTNAIAKLDRRTFGGDQARMAAALPRIAGPSHNKYALDWFYDRLPTEVVTNAQEIFIAQVFDRSGSEGLALLVSLAFDPRFDGISEPALRALLLRINARLPTPLVESPYESLPDTGKDTILAGWRKAVRDSAPRWR